VLAKNVTVSSGIHDIQRIRRSSVGRMLWAVFTFCCRSSQNSDMIFTKMNNAPTGAGRAMSLFSDPWTMPEPPADLMLRARGLDSLCCLSDAETAPGLPRRVLDEAAQVAVKLPRQPTILGYAPRPTTTLPTPRRPVRARRRAKVSGRSGTLEPRFSLALPDSGRSPAGPACSYSR
jgi:hypothetical protein